MDHTLHLCRDMESIKLYRILRIGITALFVLLLLNALRVYQDLKTSVDHEIVAIQTREEEEPVIEATEATVATPVPK